MAYQRGIAIAAILVVLSPTFGMCSMGNILGSSTGAYWVCFLCSGASWMVRVATA